MKRQISHHQLICNQVPAVTAQHLANSHAALKEKVLRSAHTDYYDRGEREVMREELAVISARYQTLTGHGLR